MWCSFLKRPPCSRVLEIQHRTCVGRARLRSSSLAAVTSGPTDAGSPRFRRPSEGPHRAKRCTCLCRCQQAVITATHTTPLRPLAPRRRASWFLANGPTGTRPWRPLAASRHRAQWSLAIAPTGPAPACPLAPLRLHRCLAPWGCTSRPAPESCSCPLSPSPFPGPLMLHCGPTPVPPFPNDAVAPDRRQRRAGRLPLVATGPGFVTGPFLTLERSSSSCFCRRARSPVAVASGLRHPRPCCCRGRGGRAVWALGRP